MSKEDTVACSLDRGELRRRLAAIAEIGRSSLISRALDGDRHLLRFRADERTGGRLRELVAAEAECCAFLEMALEREGDELILSIAAPEEGQALAEALAKSFEWAVKDSNLQP